MLSVTASKTLLNVVGVSKMLGDELSTSPNQVSLKEVWFQLSAYIHVS